MLIFTLLLLCMAFFILFSSEFVRLGNWVLALPGAKVFLPLFIASFLVVYFDVWVYWALMWVNWSFHALKMGLASYLPFGNMAVPVSHFLCLFIFPLVPIFVFTLLGRRRISREPWMGMYWFALVLWLALVFLQ